MASSSGTGHDAARLMAHLCDATYEDVLVLILDSGGFFTACPLCGKPATDHPKEAVDV